jgi:uncharacterized membrane protein YfcA
MPPWMNDPALWLFAGVILLAYTVQTVTGFGSTLVCVALGAQLFPVEEVVAIAVALSFVQTSYIVLRHHAGIRWKLLLARVFPLMIAGMAAGFFFSRDLSGPWLRIAFAVLLLALSLRELFVLYRKARERPPMPAPASIATMLGAGFVHGVYGTGGPLLVYAVGREGLSKGELRATLATVWLALDLVLAVLFFSDGRYQPTTLHHLAFVAPALPIGLVLGELVHRHVDEKRFKTALFALLIAAAIMLLARR